MPNPIITAIRSGSAPKQARMAAARGMLPLAQEDLLEALVALTQDPEQDVRSAASETLNGVDMKTILQISQNRNSSVDLLEYIAVWRKSPINVLEAIILNEATPDSAIAQLARQTSNGSLLEAITINTQRLIRHSDIIEAIMSNPARTPEAERRAREVKEEFFEKAFGVSVVAEEQKARLRVSKLLGAEVSEEEFQHVLSQFEADNGIRIEDGDVLVSDPEAELRRMLYEAELDGMELSEERRSQFQLVAMMSVKERIFLALRGNREARLLLCRDSNRLVAAAVIKNPKITDGEIEAITKLKWIHEELLRSIAMNRAWSSNYTIMHNLVLNPRTPLAFSMGFLTRLQARDLKSLTKNKGVPDSLRNQANRMCIQRKLSN